MKLLTLLTIFGFTVAVVFAVSIEKEADAETKLEPETSGDETNRQLGSYPPVLYLGNIGSQYMSQNSTISGGLSGKWALFQSLFQMTTPSPIIVVLNPTETSTPTPPTWGTSSPWTTSPSNPSWYPPTSAPTTTTTTTPRPSTMDLIQQIAANKLQMISGSPPSPSIQYVYAGQNGQLPGGITQQFSGGITQQLSGGITQQLPGGLSQKIPAELMQQISGGLTQQLSGGLTQQISGGLPQQLSAGVMQQLPAGLAQQLGVDKVQVVQVTAPMQPQPPPHQRRQRRRRPQRRRRRRRPFRGYGRF